MILTNFNRVVHLTNFRSTNNLPIKFFVVGKLFHSSVIKFSDNRSNLNIDRVLEQTLVK